MPDVRRPVSSIISLSGIIKDKVQPKNRIVCPFEVIMYNGVNAGILFPLAKQRIANTVRRLVYPPSLSFFFSITGYVYPFKSCFFQRIIGPAEHHTFFTIVNYKTYHIKIENITKTK